MKVATRNHDMDDRTRLGVADDYAIRMDDLRRLLELNGGCSLAAMKALV